MAVPSSQYRSTCYSIQRVRGFGWQHGVSGRVMSYRIVGIEAVGPILDVCVFFMSKWNGKEQGKKMYINVLCSEFKD